jgi:hypothetical protein
MGGGRTIGGAAPPVRAEQAAAPRRGGRRLGANRVQGRRERQGAKLVHRHEARRSARGRGRRGAGRAYQADSSMGGDEGSQGR